MSQLSDAELDQIERRADAATPGPWFVRFLDDVNAMNLVAVSTQPDTGQGERWPDFEQSTIIAATVVQEPRYVDIEDGRWDENARFIAQRFAGYEPKREEATRPPDPGRAPRPSTTLDYSSARTA
jgi:hypothetical protein